LNPKTWQLRQDLAIANYSCYYFHPGITIKRGKSMGALAWYELIVFWGFAVLIVILDRKNWNK
jgi:hypothetical protein